ncbi:YwmB family TATA-box binding protein [Paenibacillus sp. JX-17]|uniref:YwmB family TATA-box binding protein n=1 Tax=Paenibacillus lacisoli TaxID=3064525 RepID=A0ABT9CHW4_9BACL|nr:YwmB family TATA-box binding protein [Paenibacillus sp. JX-17]MDO7908872.1 YwmB family TATA-box binding protein [Paenibacillus sp. JX-17]
MSKGVFRNPNMFVMMMILIMAVVLTTGFQNGGKGDKPSTAAPAEAKAELQQLLDLTFVSQGQPEHTVLKWQGDWNGLNGEHAEAAAQQAARMLGLPNPVLEEVNGHPVYRSEAEFGGISFKWNVIEKEASSWYAVLRIDFQGSGTQPQLLAYQEQAAAVFHQSGIKGAWNVSFQWLKAVQDVKEQLKQAEQTIAAQVPVQQLESYEDAASASTSYTSGQLPVSVMSGSQAMQMQIAVHQNDALHVNRLTIGFPVITIEY